MAETSYPTPDPRTPPRRSAPAFGPMEGCDRRHGRDRRRPVAGLGLGRGRRGYALILSLAPCAVRCVTGYCVICKSKGCDAAKTPTDVSATTRD